MGITLPIGNSGGGPGQIGGGHGGAATNGTHGPQQPGGQQGGAQGQGPPGNLT